MEKQSLHPVIHKIRFSDIPLSGLDFKRKIWTSTGIQTSNLEISGLALYDLSNSGSIDGTGLNLSLEGSANERPFDLWHCNHLISELTSSLLLYSDVYNQTDE